jgi:hypothetical protein
MISGLLRFLGIDLQQQIRSIAATIVLALAGVAMVLVAAGIGVDALYLWLSLEYGVFPALGILGGASVLIGIIFLILAFWPSRKQHPAVTLAEATHTAKTGAAAMAQTAIQDFSDFSSQAIRRAPRQALLGIALTAVFVSFLAGRRV